MDDLKAKVGTIESALQASSRLLQSLEEKAHKSISEEVTGMRDALMDSDHRIQYVSSKVQPFLATIEYGDPSSIDLSPQMNWLSTHLGFIVGKLQTAESRADSALSYAQTYRYQFKDVGQTVEMNKTELEVSQKNSEGLASEVKSQLRESELLMEQTQSKIRDKENEISRKTIRASLLRLRTQELESEIETTRSAISTAEREAERKKENGAAVGVGAGILGIALVPFTGGVSLVLTGIGAGVGIGTAINVSELREEAKNARAAAGRLQNEISEAEQELSNLVQEKNDLQSLVRQYQSEVNSRESCHIDYQAQIQKSRLVQSDILLLKGRAASMSSNVQEVESVLQKMKERFDQCSASLSAQFSELCTSTNLLARPLRQSHRRTNKFQRQKRLVQEILSSLEKIHMEVPALLPSQGTKFLDFK